MKHIRNVIAGAIIGVANIIPGVSGGTMAVVLGVYDKLISSISLNLKKLKQNWLFLLTILGGAGVGILLFANILTYCFENYNVPTQFFFIGLIAGSIPLIYEKTTEHKKFQTINIIPFSITLLSMILLGAIKEPSNLGIQTNLSVSLFVILVLSSILASISMIIPGLSGSFILKALGQYETVLAAIDRLDIIMLIPVGIGVVIGILGGAKLISILFKKFHQGIYAAILGLIIGSIFTIIPKDFALNAHGIIAIFTFAFGIFLTAIMDIFKKD